jgi:hypothetical protein
MIKNHPQNIKTKKSKRFIEILNSYKTYDSNGISFHYPTGWNEVSPDKLSLTVEGILKSWQW